jgi:hypothetical protein
MRDEVERQIVEHRQDFIKNKLNKEKMYTPPTKEARFLAQYIADHQTPLTQDKQLIEDLKSTVEKVMSATVTLVSALKQNY